MSNNPFGSSLFRPLPISVREQPGVRRRRFIIAFVIPLSLFLLLATIVGLSFLPASFNPQSLLVTIPRGSSPKEIAGLLKKKRLIRSSFAFLFLVRLMGEEKNLKAGDYLLSPHLWPAEIIDKLARGESLSVWVTIPEGYTTRQIAEKLERLGLVDAHRFLRIARWEGRSFRNSRFLPPANLEGFLFPDTYKISRGATERQIIEMMVKNFQRKVIAPLETSFRQAEQEGRSLREIIILASLVEREAKYDRDRPLIAGVLLNRLQRGMPLECDATVQYALGITKSRLTSKDLAVDSPYNTYKHKGLPPGPICNPGLKSILSALNPAETPYLFYVARPDGYHFFSRTIEEHNEAKRRFAREREAGSF